MKQILFTLLFLLTAVSSYAAKASAPSRDVTLQDGRTVSVSLIGDELLHFFTTDDGEVILFKDGAYRTATGAELDSINAHAAMIQAQRDTEMSAIAAGVSLMSNERINATVPCPCTGNVRIPVVMVEFTDTVFRYGKSELEKLLNSKECQTPETFDKTKPWGSISEYFRFCSNGKLSLSFDIYGPYKVSRSIKYYSESNDWRKSELFREVIDLAKADIDFSQYDSNNDGYVDAFNIFYAGWNENHTGHEIDLWPRSGTENFGTYDGKKIWRWGMEGELLGTPSEAPYWNNGNPYFTGHGVMIHEFCHNLGLPDLYPTAGWDKKANVEAYDNQSMERWDLMDDGENMQGGLFPMPISAFERELFGWDTLDTLSEASDVTLKTFLNGGKGIRILNDNDASGNEYYILEALPASKQGQWYAAVPASGLLITHINYDFSSFGNFSNPNNRRGEPRITVMAADGNLPSSYRLAIKETDTYAYKRLTGEQFNLELKGDVYPGLQKVTSFTDYKAYTGTIDKPITDIVKNSDYSISFKFMGGGPVKVAQVAADKLSGISRIYNMAGQEIRQLQHGCNIIVTESGETQKVLIP